MDRVEALTVEFFQVYSFSLTFQRILVISRTVDLEANNLNADELCVYQFLKLWPDQHVSEWEISRQVKSKPGQMESSDWIRPALLSLIEHGLIEKVGECRYCLRGNSTVKLGGKAKFLSPHLMEILTKSGQGFDLRA
jgi:hypothetical protein